MVVNNGNFNVGIEGTGDHGVGFVIGSTFPEHNTAPTRIAQISGNVNVNMGSDVYFLGDVNIGGNITVGTSTSSGKLSVGTRLTLSGDTNITLGSATGTGINVGALMLNTAGETKIIGANDPDIGFVVRNRYVAGREGYAGYNTDYRTKLATIRSEIGTGEATGGAAILTVVDKSVSFRDGFDLLANGILRSEDNDAEVYLGEYANIGADHINQDGVINLKGGILDGGRYTLSIAPISDLTNHADDEDYVATGKIVAESGTSHVRGTVSASRISAEVNQGATVVVYNTLPSGANPGKNTWSSMTPWSGATLSWAGPSPWRIPISPIRPTRPAA